MAKSTNNGPMDAESSSKPKYSRRSHLFGALILLAITASFVGSSWVTQQLKMPFFCSYFNNSFSAIYIVPYLVRMMIRGNPQQDFMVTKNESLRNVHWETIRQALLFMPLIFFMSVTFNWSLDHTSMSNNSVICSSSSFFALMFSWLLMRSPIRLINMMGAILIMVGIFLVSWFTESSDDSGSTIGDVAAMVSAILSGFYTSLLSKRIPDGSPVNMTLFFGLIGLFGAIAFMPAIYLLHHFEIENCLVQVSGAEVGGLFLNAFLTISANLMWAKAVQLTSPFMATIGIGLTTPLTMLVEFVVHKKGFSMAYCFGVGLVILGYLITNIQHHKEGEESLKETKAITGSKLELSEMA